MIAAGVGLGTAAAFMAVRLLERFVQGVQPTGPSTFAIMISVLVAAALSRVYAGPPRQPRRPSERAAPGLRHWS